MNTAFLYFERTINENTKRNQNEKKLVKFANNLPPISFYCQKLVFDAWLNKRNYITKKNLPAN